MSGSEAVPQGSPYGGNNYPEPLKSAGIGIILSFLFVGLGHLYAGQISKGIILFVVSVVLMTLSILFIFPLFAVFILWIWAMYDVNNTIKQYNQHIRNTGNPPW